MSDDNERSAAEIEASIEQTRERLSTEIGAIQDKFRPRNLKRQASKAVRSVVEHNIAELIRLVKRNPVPAVMIGAGVGWLLARNRKQ